MRKDLSVTQREIVIGRDKSRCCKALVTQSRIYPRDVYCPECNFSLKYEHEIIFGKQKIKKEA